MKTIFTIRKMLIISILNVLLVGMAYSQTTIGHTEITKWQYGKKGAVSITYDDGTINQFRVALPIMNRLGLPGTFYIITGRMPDAKYPGKFVGRPVSKIIEESKTIPTNANNAFERASAARYLGFRGTGSYYDNAGAAIDANRLTQAYSILDDLYKKVAAGEFQPETPRNRSVSAEDVLTWDMVRTHAAEGHEFASHMLTHPYAAAFDDANLKYELEKSREEILKQVGIRHTLSAELPYGTQNERAIKAALKVYPVLRNRIAEDYVLELHRPNRQSPINTNYEYVFWERGIVTATTLDQMNEWVDIAASQDNIWLVTVIHGIEGIGWEPLTAKTVDDHFSYIKSRDDKLWVATFADAARYIKQRMNAKVSSSQKGEAINIKLTHSLNKNLYDIPLTLKTYVNPSWGEVNVKQGKTLTKVKVQREGSAAFVMYQAMPGKETIEISCLSNAPKQADPVIVAYVVSRGPQLPDPTYFTHINYAFGYVNETFNGITIQNEERLQAISNLKQVKPSLKVLLSLGGWSRSHGFSEMASDETFRKAFVADCKRVVDQFNLDGIDLDWEYPTSSESGIKSSPDDTKNFTLLMREIREIIGKDKLLTLATSSSGRYIDFKAIEPYADWVCMMTYDMGMPPYHHAALYPSEHTRRSASESLELHLNAGMPANKLVLGIPFYGKGAPNISFRDIPSRTEFTQQWDDEAKVPYLTNAEGEFVFTYENVRSIGYKCEFLKTKGLLGAMYWQYDQDDANGSLRKAVYDGVMNVTK